MFLYNWIISLPVIGDVQKGFFKALINTKTIKKAKSF
jgi:hypothetical protein